MKQIINLVLLTCALMVLVMSTTATAEETMINPQHLKDLVVQPTLEKMETAFPGAANPAAVNLLVGIAAHESTIGGVTYLKQDGGPALGIYQIEPATHLDVWANYLNYHEDKADQLLEFSADEQVTVTGPAENPIYWVEDSQLIVSLEYPTAVARVIIYRASFSGWPEPDDVEGLARIWKDHYNTAHGAGTVEQFVGHFPREIL